MNAADIAAARRLIAQFNGESAGRHNSARDMRARPVVEGQAQPAIPMRDIGPALRALGLSQPMIPRRLAAPKERPEDCAVGDWVEYLPGIPPTHEDRVRVPVNTNRLIGSFWEDGEIYSEMPIYEFQPFRWSAPGDLRIGWRRVS